MESATLLPSTSSTSATTTLAPSPANSRAVAAPIPEAAPVTMATLSCKRIGVSSELALVLHGLLSLTTAALRPIIGRALDNASELGRETMCRNGTHKGRKRRDLIVHLVGSIPLPDAETVLRRVCEAVGPYLLRIPDGETGIRKTWIKFLQDVLAENPAIEVADDVPPFKF